MKLFRKNTDAVTISDKAANGIAGLIIKSNNLFGHHLNKLTGRWQNMHRKIFFFSIVILFCGCNVLMLLQSFRNSKVQSFRAPASITTTKSITNKSKAFQITNDEIQKVREYKSKHPDLSTSNPILYDSLLLIEQIYSSQQK